LIKLCVNILSDPSSTFPPFSDWLVQSESAWYLQVWSSRRYIGIYHNKHTMYVWTSARAICMPTTMYGNKGPNRWVHISLFCWSKRGMQLLTIYVLQKLKKNISFSGSTWRWHHHHPRFWISSWHEASQGPCTDCRSCCRSSILLSEIRCKRRPLAREAGVCNIVQMRGHILNVIRITEDLWS
jgi:hypothetical protein